MAERPPYVRHRRQGGIAHRIAPIGGILLAAGAVAAVAWGVTKVAGDDPAPPPTTASSSVPTPPTARIIFPEGFTRKDMANRVTVVNKIAKRKRNIDATKLTAKRYLASSVKGPVPADFKDQKMPNLEGFLFPATYDFTEDTTSRALVLDQLEAFDDAWSDVDLKYAKSKNLTAYDVLIIASMIEKEVVVPKERPLVSAVIYNRLHNGMPLGIDATIRYGLDIPPTEPIHQSDLDSDSPYNTRCPTCAGLPPTPIANPGLAAIQAAAHPAKVDYLYFVRKPDCKHHFFTANLDEFNAYPRGGLQC
jgi:uncharacterized YceG family protein